MRGLLGGFEGGDGFLVLLSSLSRGRIASLAVSSTSIQLNGGKTDQLMCKIDGDV